jgi:hypothetical protein
MRFTSLLLLSIFLAASVAVAAPVPQSAESAPMIATAENLAPLVNSATLRSHRFTPSQPLGGNSLGSSDGICYKIRAYVFKQDDDRAPEFLRSTTCGPRPPHTADAQWPKAKVIPEK